MTKKHEVEDLVFNLITYIEVNKNSDCSIGGANLDYVLIMLQRLQQKINDIEELEIQPPPIGE